MNEFWRRKKICVLQNVTIGPKYTKYEKNHVALRQTDFTYMYFMLLLRTWPNSFANLTSYGSNNY